MEINILLIVVSIVFGVIFVLLLFAVIAYLIFYCDYKNSVSEDREEIVESSNSKKNGFAKVSEKKKSSKIYWNMR